MRAAIPTFAVALLACGGSAYDGGGDGGSSRSGGDTPQYLIEIQGMAFSPLRLEVAPGATVTVRNLDAMAHSVTSASSPEAFTPGDVAGISFDTGVFTGERTFTIPDGAPLGTEIPYYCSTHGSTMATPNGTVVITATPASAAPGDGGDRPRY